MQVQKFQIRKFLLIEPHIAYPQISAKVSSPEIANLQIFPHKTERMKHSLPLKQNYLAADLFGRIFYFIKIQIRTF
jgi:hypothetical protein